jgi:hypothetical protein
MLETAGARELVGPDTRVRGKLRVPGKRPNANRCALDIVSGKQTLVEISAEGRAAD